MVVIEEGESGVGVRAKEEEGAASEHLDCGGDFSGMLGIEDQPSGLVGDPWPSELAS